MSDGVSLVTELAIILIAAGVFTIISRALKQPLILGYIVAGFLVGPNLGIFPQFSSESVHQWSDIGIIFLLFGLGLEFSFKKLLKVGSSALILAGCIFLGMFGVGLIVGQTMGWTMMESTFLGGMLSMSSTTIIIKTYEDLGLKKKPYAGLIFGTLVIEDLLAILLMVLLSTMAVSNKFAGGEMVMGIAKLVFFLILWFLVGIYLIPTVLKKAHKYLSDEILLIVSIGLCFGMVALANLAGFSSALGAFVMGSILSETVDGERIEHLTLHIKELFGAIFFVSVGMMVDPKVIAEHWGAVLAITLVAMTGICLFAIFGVLISGKGLDNAVHTGFSMAQLGEFAFIIAGVGCSLGVLRDFIYPVVIAVSVITAFATPYVIKLGDPATAFLYRKLPPRILARIEPQEEASTAGSKAEENTWKSLFTSYLVRVGLYGVVLIAILLGSGLYLGKLASSLFPEFGEKAIGAIVGMVTLFVMMPFLYGLAVNNGSIAAPAKKLLKEKTGNRWPILGLMFLRVAIAVAFVLVVILRYFDLAGWSVLLIVLAALIFFFTARFSVHKFTRLERHFLENFNEKETHERKIAPVTSQVKEKLAGYDIHLEQYKVPSECSFAGKTLREMPFRHNSGVNIVKILRGTRSILIPRGDECIFPGDVLLAVGTSEQTASFASWLKENTETSVPEQEEFAVEPVVIDEESYLLGKTLREADLRASGLMVISIVESDRIITNPGPDQKFEAGQTVWLAGLKSSLDWYK